jgi:hypothetical protein
VPVRRARRPEGGVFTLVMVLCFLGMLGVGMLGGMSGGMLG